MDRLLDAMKYPERARRKDIQGKVWVGFIVRPNGGASHVRVVKSVHPLLDREARRVVKQVRFEPGLKAGTPVPVKMVMPFTFRTRTPFETEGMDGP